MNVAHALIAFAGGFGGLGYPVRGVRGPRLKPNPERETTAEQKRARKAAKRAEDARRTEAGRARYLGSSSPWWVRPYGLWDAVEREMSSRQTAPVPSGWAAGGAVEVDGVVHTIVFVDRQEMWLHPASEPRWRQRLNHRRSLPMTDAHTTIARIWRQARAAGKPWFCGADHGRGRTAAGRKQHTEVRRG